ncbi:NHLP leader peptide family RiPP precursor [Cylindrospermum sp. FACHB-282]|uniref:NHLP leader peptide family RiPP precursor n=1 Tax=Cylindrospermum sp. FACHB-282 TaxID=2692794 RepID=UPI0016896285|nr:NHLP leader peptide family RiPP precursor [Cylindrospermum sp. FACHB-282]MBD2387092.1 NHLP leader peptide family natural product precursor [Cylindrospermum sp. FACHB-282]
MSFHEVFQPQKLEEKIIAKAMEDPTYKQCLISNPKAVIEKELGEKLADDLIIEVIQQSPKHLYLLLPAEIDELVAAGIISESELNSVAGGVIPLVSAISWGIATTIGRYTYDLYNANKKK